MDLQRLRTHYPWITLVVLTAIIGLIDPAFLRPENLIGLAGDISTLFIMALGITFVIYIGGIDLSSQSIANMTTVLATLLLPVLGGLSAVACIGVGALFGFASGFVTTRLKVPSFISTLAVGGIAMSLGQYASGQRALYMDAELHDRVFGWVNASIAGIPNKLIISIVLLLAMLFVERRTVVGRALKAIGAGELAAVASGIHVDRFKIGAFVISGAFAAMAGVIFAITLSGGSPVIADGFLLPAIVAVLVGGTPLTGGVGGVLNTAIGTLIVAVVRTSMLYLNIPATAQQMFFGAVLIAAIALTIDRSKVKTVK
jgi:ribose transport system permease protein